VRANYLDLMHTAAEHNVYLVGNRSVSDGH
jgi:hypothetical protein